MAIALDVGSNGSNGTGTTVSWSHTCTGSNLILLVAISCDHTSTLSNILYNGVAMTLLQRHEGNTVDIAVYYLLAPATGAHTVTFDHTGGGSACGVSASYTGVLQSGVPDNAVYSAFHATGTDSTLSITPVAANCWGVHMSGWNGGYTITGGTNITLRGTNGAGSTCMGIGDTNGTISGATSTALHSTSDWYNATVITLAPAAAVVALAPPFQRSNWPVIRAATY